MIVIETIGMKISFMPTMAPSMGFRPSSMWPVDVLHHDDGVVDHKTDGEHHREQRQQS